MGLLDGKVCVITGAGSGVGRAACLLFAREGASVVGGDLRAEWGERTAGLVAGEGRKMVFQPCDVTREDDVARLIEVAVEHHGRLDVMFNNAGIGSPKVGLRLQDHDDADWDRLLAVNLRGIVYGCKHAVLRFEAQGGGGTIVNTGSVAGMVGFGGVPYGVTKAAVMQLTRGLAIEVAGRGIRVNGFAPGTMFTNFGKDEADAFRTPSAEELAEWGSYNPTKRATTPEECAATALFLATDLAPNMTGAIVPVDGGYVAR